MIPALKDAEFVRYGVMHRNTYLNSPQLLDRYYRLSRAAHSLRGADDGVEGYIESCASGMLAGLEAAARLQGEAPFDFPRETAIGALALYVSESSVASFQPMNASLGIISPLDKNTRQREKNAAISERALGIVRQLSEGR